MSSAVMTRPLEVAEDVFDLDLGVIPERSSSVRPIYLQPTGYPENTCSVHTLVTCYFTCGGISGRPCAC